MALAPGTNAAADTRDPRDGAETLFLRATWIYRRCTEITAEPRADVLKVYDLASKCFRFREEADRWFAVGELTEVVEALIERTRQAGKGHPDKTDAEIKAEYKALYTAAGAFLTWAQANLPQAGTDLPASMNAAVTINRAWPNTDIIVRVDRAAALQNEVDKLLAEFA